MNALLIVAHAIALQSAEAPLVLDDCGSDSAARAAVIARMDPAASDTLASVAELLLEPDGATCLMESWALVALHRAQPGTEIVTRTLVDGLASDRPHVAARAARLVRVLGVGDAAAFVTIIRRPEMTPGAWRVLDQELSSMRASPRKHTLAFAVEIARPATAATAAR